MHVPTKGLGLYPLVLPIGFSGGLLSTFPTVLGKDGSVKIRTSDRVTGGVPLLRRASRLDGDSLAKRPLPFDRIVDTS